MSTMQKYAEFLGRVLIAALFLLTGLMKIPGYVGTQHYMVAMGVPAFLLPMVIALEVGGAIAIVVGWQTRLVALAFAVFSIGTALLFHLDFAQQMQMIMFLKNFAIAGGFLVIFAYGPGPISLDRRRASP